MMRSLFAGVSGLRNHQTRMDVIGNNIANVNTVGFKSARVNFQDVLSQTLQGAASGSTGGRGGTNPMQVGLGMGLASIDTIFTDGSFQPTGKSTDLSIKGQGFFILSDGTNEVFTRAGNFDFDSEGNFLVPGTGYKVMGWSANNGVLDTSTPVSAIKIPVGTLMAPKASTSLSFLNNLSSDAPIGTSYQATKDVYDSLGTAHSVKEIFQKVGPNKWLMGTSVSGVTGSPAPRLREITFAADGSISAIKDVTALAANWNDITIGGAAPDVPLQLNTTVGSVSSFNLTVTDEGLQKHDLEMRFTRNAADWTFELIEGGKVLSTQTGVTTAAMPATITVNNTTFNLNFTVNGGPAFITPSPVSSPDPTSGYTPGTGTTGSINFTPSNGANPVSLALNFNGIKQYGGETTVEAGEQDGYAAGTLDSTTIDTDGIITGVFTNGKSQTLGRVALATFNNPAGLTKVGDSLFEKSNNSGDPQRGISGSGGRGTFTPGTLEMANVDLAQEFSNMIITQRGFQANSKIISVTDEMLQDLANLKR